MLRVLLFFWFLLRVPYLNQHSPEWWIANDCGPAVANMLIEYYTGEVLHPFQYYADMNIPFHTLQSESNIAEWLTQRGVPSQTFHDWTFEELKQKVRVERIPVIVTIQTDHGGHFVIITGITSTYVFVHDPWVSQHYPYPIDTFMKMWEYEWSWTEFTGIVPDNARN